MQALERQLQTRYPRWFAGPGAGLGRALLRGFGRWSRLAEIEAFLERNADLRDFDFLEAALAYLGVDYRVEERTLATLPANGRLLIVANHPCGGLDAMALLHAVGRVRRDVRIVANDVLMRLEPMAGLFLPVQAFGGSTGPDRLRAIERALEAEQCVIVFPAGEVSRLGLRGVRDARWRGGFVRFARRTGAPILPVRIGARNSALFYGASALYRPAGTALLARELFAGRGRPLQIHIGRPIRLPDDIDPAEGLREVRRALYALGRGEPPAQAPEAIAPAIDQAKLLMAVAGTELLGRTGDGKEIRLARIEAGMPLLDEIGRLRELTFRAVGEGTGRSRDVDEFDPHYEHILVWDATAGRIAGAYRVARAAQVLARYGLAGLYTASLFRYSERAVPRIAQGLELGRSFVAPEYWGSRSLDYLWQGIGAYLRRHPDVRYLFGAVSISAALPVAAREQLVAYYQRYYGSDDAAAASLRPFRYFAAPPSFGELDAATAFGVLKANLAAHGVSVPVLYKQYTELCEPGGARFLAFGVDPDFGDAVDGLIEVDLERIRPKKRERYLAPAEMAA
ncbi:MAG: GNAT family N-acyltransferase [Pseudomonadota bacterium]